jgi:hypothetical protein
MMMLRMMSFSERMGITHGVGGELGAGWRSQRAIARASRKLVKLSDRRMVGNAVNTDHAIRARIPPPPPARVAPGMGPGRGVDLQQLDSNDSIVAGSGKYRFLGGRDAVVVWFERQTKPASIAGPRSRSRSRSRPRPSRRRKPGTPKIWMT